VIGFAGEKRLGLERRDVAVRGVDLAVEILQKLVLLLRVGFFFRKMDVGLNVAGKRREPLICANLLFGALAVAKNSLSRLLIAPEIGVGGACFEAL
jgi:hypothetical protein